MDKGKLSASMMCASLDKVFYYLAEFKRTELEFLHIDIMDGEFVPNFALGTDYVRSLRRLTSIPFDFHFLTIEPLKKMAWFDIREGDQVAFHYECNDSIDECIAYVKRIGAKCFIAINPETNFRVLDPYLNDIDGILVMMVNPGFAGKRMLPNAIKKVQDLVDYLNAEHRDYLEIEVDGNITIEHAKELYEIGANIFVSGSSSLFKSTELPINEVIQEKRKVIGWDSPLQK